jgi:oligosaccharide reducing-end xylanase
MKDVLIQKVKHILLRRELIMRVTVLCIIVLLEVAAYAQTAQKTINLSGTVKDGKGTAIAGATVTLMSDSSLKDTTIANGEFTISNATAITAGGTYGIPVQQVNSMCVKGNQLRFSIAAPADKGVVAIFAGNGKRSVELPLGKMEAGVQSHTLPALAPGYYIVNITIGQSTATTRLIAAGSGFFMGDDVAEVKSSPRISRNAAATTGVDTLMVKKEGYKTVKKAITSYEQAGIAIVTDTVSAANKDNLFATILGKTEEEIDAKLEAAFQQLFYGHKDTETIYYEGGPGAYMYDKNNGDVRSEGQSYGMMITVQMDKEAEFKKIWAWTKQVMGKGQANTFGWKASTGGSLSDPGSAPDGEEYIAAALIFAGKLWNNSSYTTDGKSVCKAMESFFVDGIIKFVPSASYNDPSYILPAFYEVFAAVDNQSFWSNAASKGRSFLKKVCHPETMLGPYLANFDGSAYTQVMNNTPGNTYRDDCWRICLNIMADWRFFAKDQWQKDSFAPKHAAFMKSVHKPDYPEKMYLDGRIYDKAWPDPCKGLVAPLGMLAFAIPDDENAKFFVQTLWDMKVPSGNYRYYDGLLYMMSLLHVAGRFQLYY